MQLPSFSSQAATTNRTALASCHLADSMDRAAMHWSLERMREELHGERLGGSLILQQLAHMVLIQALRLHLSAERLVHALCLLYLRH